MIRPAFLQGLTPYEFVESMKKKGIRVPGIGHRYTDGFMVQMSKTFLVCNIVVFVFELLFDCSGFGGC